MPRWLPKLLKRIGRSPRMTKAVTRNDTRTAGRRVVPNDACPRCGTIMREARGRLKVPINGDEVAVPSASHMKCPKCGEIVLRFQEARRLHEDACEVYRRKHGLLSADEIRALREHFDLTQAALARLLRLGANTVSRWEAGRNVQTGAMDILLRLIRDLPGSLDYLRNHAA
jgi:putative zinc finger/helix-turn-helix YgiT family protein